MTSTLEMGVAESARLPVPTAGSLEEAGPTGAHVVSGMVTRDSIFWDEVVLKLQQRDTEILSHSASPRSVSVYTGCQVTKEKSLGVKEKNCILQDMEARKGGLNRGLSVAGPVEVQACIGNGYGKAEQDPAVPSLKLAEPGNDAGSAKSPPKPVITPRWLIPVAASGVYPNGLSGRGSLKRPSPLWPDGGTVTGHTQLFYTVIATSTVPPEVDGEWSRTTRLLSTEL